MWVGVALDEQGVTYPFGYVKKDTKLLQLTADNKLKASKSVERRAFLDLTEETEIAGRAYMITGRRAAGAQGSPADPRLAAGAGRRPSIRGSGGSMSGVSQRLLVAYEGARPVYVTLVSTGREGVEGGPLRGTAARSLADLQQARVDDDGRQLGDRR